jgi:cytochrome c biogenesis protein
MVATPAPAPSIGSPSRLAKRRDLVEVVWEMGASLKPTIPLLILIALACVLGTFANPENVSLNEVAAALSKQPDTFMGVLWRTGIYSFFELNDLFHSWWFLLLLVLLSLNLTACTIDRLPRIYTIALKPRPRLDDVLLRSVRHVVKQPFSGEPAQEAARLAAAFKVRGFNVASVDRADDDTYYLFSERGRYSRFGVYVVHAALLLILTGGILGRFFGYEGTINVFQGGGIFNFVFLKTGDGSVYKHDLPVTVRVDDFRHSLYKDGQDKSFESDLSVLGPGGTEVYKQTITVGHPMEYAGWTFYQASYQPAPDRSVAKMAVVDKKSGERKEFKVRPDITFGLAREINYQIVDYQPDRIGLGPAAHIVRRATEAEGGVSDFWVYQNAPDFDLQNREDRFGLQFEGIQEMFYTGLQVARDPGAKVVFLGCFILFAGLFTAFYTSHRRLWAKVTRNEVIVAGTAHKNHFVFEKVFASLEEAVRGTQVTELPKDPGANSSGDGSGNNGSGNSSSGGSVQSAV